MVKSWLWGIVFFAASFASGGVLSQQELSKRQTALAETYRYLASTFPKALLNPRMDIWLQHEHFSKPLFLRVEQEIDRRANAPLSLAELEFQFPDSEMDCGRADELGVALTVTAYTSRDKKIHFCNSFFRRSLNDRAETLLHEHIHVAGIIEECETEAVAFLTFYAAGTPTNPSYLQRCASFRSFFKLLLESDAKNADRLKAEVKLIPGKVLAVGANTSAILNQKRAISIEWCELKFKADEKRTAEFQTLKFIEMDRSEKVTVRYRFEDSLGRGVELVCAAHVILTVGKLAAFGILL